MNPSHGVVVGTAVGLLLGSSHFEAVFLPAQPSSASVEETDVGVVEPEGFNGGSGAGDRVNFDLLIHEFTEAVGELLRALVGVLVLLFQLKSDHEAVVLIAAF